MAFKNRRDAGRRLAQALDRFRDTQPVVLALPRGGVPVAFEVAMALGATLDVVPVRKIGAPGAPGYAVGAVVGLDRPEIVPNDDAEARLGLLHGWVESEGARQLLEIERQRRLYIGERPPPAVEDRTVIVVDDGLATGTTALAVLHVLRRLAPAWLVLAVPVAPRETVEKLQAEADEVVTLETPEAFRAVSLHYESFGQTSEEEVVELLRVAAR